MQRVKQSPAVNCLPAKPFFQGKRARCVGVGAFTDAQNVGFLSDYPTRKRPLERTRNMTRFVAAGLGMAAIVGLSIAGIGALPQDQPQAPSREQPPTDRPLSFEPEPVRVLDPDTIAVRLLLGVADQEVRPWDRKVSVDRGEVVGVEGWRFRQTGKLSGRDSWEASSLLGPQSQNAFRAQERVREEEQGRHQ